MDKHDRNEKAIKKDRLTVVKLTLVSAAAIYLTLAGSEKNWLFSILIIGAAFFMLMYALGMFLNLFDVKKITLIFSGHSEMLLVNFAFEMYISVKDAEKLLISNFSKKYFIGYIDDAHETIILRSSEKFDAKNYAKFLDAVQDDYEKQKAQHAAEHDKKHQRSEKTDLSSGSDTSDEKHQTIDQ